MVHDRDVERDVVFGGLEREPGCSDRLVVRAARDQDDVVPALVQAGSHHPADATGSVDDEAGHGRT